MPQEVFAGRRLSGRHVCLGQNDTEQGAAAVMPGVAERDSASRAERRHLSFGYQAFDNLRPNQFVPMAQSHPPERRRVRCVCQQGSIPEVRTRWLNLAQGCSSQRMTPGNRALEPEQMNRFYFNTEKRLDARAGVSLFLSCCRLGRRLG
jgi:hypothetical protein